VSTVRKSGNSTNVEIRFHKIGDGSQHAFYNTEYIIKIQL